MWNSVAEYREEQLRSKNMNELCEVCAHKSLNHQKMLGPFGSFYCEACISGVSNHKFIKAGKVEMVAKTDMLQVEIPRGIDFDLVDIIGKMDGQSKDAQVATLVRLTAKAFMEGMQYQKDKGKKK